MSIDLYPPLVIHRATVDILLYLFLYLFDPKLSWKSWAWLSAVLDEEAVPNSFTSLSQTASILSPRTAWSLGPEQLSLYKTALILCPKQLQVSPNSLKSMSRTAVSVQNSFNSLSHTASSLPEQLEVSVPNSCLCPKQLYFSVPNSFKSFSRTALSLYPKQLDSKMSWTTLNLTQVVLDNAELWWKLNAE